LANIDPQFKRSFRLRLRETAPLDQALPDRSAAYRSLDAVILEELVLKGILGMSTDDIAAKRGNRLHAEHRRGAGKLDAGDYQAAFLLRPPRSNRSGPSPPRERPCPRSRPTFFPKLLTGIVFNPLA